MAIKTTGPLSMKEIQAEFGGPATNIKMSEYFRGGANVPAGTAGVATGRNPAGTQIVAAPAAAGKNQKFSYYYGTMAAVSGPNLSDFATGIVGNSVGAPPTRMSGSVFQYYTGIYEVTVDLPDIIAPAGTTGKMIFTHQAGYRRSSGDQIRPHTRIELELPPGVKIPAGQFLTFHFDSIQQTPGGTYFPKPTGGYTVGFDSTAVTPGNALVRTSDKYYGIPEPPRGAFADFVTAGINYATNRLPPMTLVNSQMELRPGYALPNVRPLPASPLPATPQDGPHIASLSWDATKHTISGKYVDAAGNPVANTRIGIYSNQVTGGASNPGGNTSRGGLRVGALETLQYNQYANTSLTFSSSAGTATTDGAGNFSVDLTWGGGLYNNWRPRVDLFTKKTIQYFAVATPMPNPSHAAQLPPSASMQIQVT